MTPHSILIALQALPVFYLDRRAPDSDRDAMNERVAEAIHRAAKNEYEAAFLVAQRDGESHGSLDVYRGNCSALPRGMRCDPDKHGTPRAAGPWQVWPRYCPAMRAHAIDSVDGLTEQAKCALSLARHGRQHCTNGWLGAFAAQSGSGSCRSREGAQRVRVMRLSLERMRKAER